MEITFSLSEMILAAVITAIGAAVQGSVGIGLGFVAVPLLALINPRFIPGPILVAALVLTLAMSYREFHSIRRKDLEWAIGGRVLGSILGALVLILLPVQNLAVFFGFMVILAVIITASGIRIPLSSKSLLAAGTLSGFMATTAAIGGAPMALLYQYQKGPNLRSTLATIFVIGVMISIVCLSVAGKFGMHDITLALIIMPGILIGFAVSGRLKKVLDIGYLRTGILTGAVLSAFIAIWQNL